MTETSRKDLIRRQTSTTAARVFCLALVAVVALLVVSGCGSYDSSLNKSADSASYEVAGGSADESDASVGQKVVVNNNISIHADKVSDTAASIEKLITSYQGYVTHKNLDTGDYAEGSISARVPSESAAKFVDDLEKKYQVASLETDTSDVTETYVNREKEVERIDKKIALYQELEKQTPVKEIKTRLGIIDAIVDLEAQKDELTNQNKSIDEQVAYRDINITLTAPPKITGQRNYWRNIGQMTVDTLETTVRVLIGLLVVAAPLAIVAAVPAFFIYRAVAKKRKAKAAEAQQK